MAQPASPAYRQYLRRSLVTGIAAALVLIIVVFLAHDAFDEPADRHPRPRRAQRRHPDDPRRSAALRRHSAYVSRLLYHDMHMGIDAGLQDVRQRCPSNKVCQRVAMPELRDIPRFNKVLVGQLHSVVEQTEQAAYDVTSRLQTIDEVVTDLNTFVAGAAAESETMALDSEAKIGGNRQLISKLEAFIAQRIAKDGRGRGAQRRGGQGSQARCRRWST
jgi:methyl-accepting chemotaxis protein